MTDTNPPQERETTDRKKLETAEAARIAKIQEIMREHGYGIPLADNDDEDLTGAYRNTACTACCVGGRATREIPCLNSSYRGCPYRRRDYSRGRERGCGS